MMDTEKKLGKRIAELRKARNESQQDVGDAIGVSREIVKYWESGSRQVKASNIAKLATHFQVTSDYLLGITEDEHLTSDIRAVRDFTGLSDKAVKELRTWKEEANDNGVFVSTLSKIIISKNFKSFLLGLYSLENSKDAMRKLCDELDPQSSEQQSKPGVGLTFFKHRYDEMRLNYLGVTETSTKIIDDGIDYQQLINRCEAAFEHLVQIDQSNEERAINIEDLVKKISEWYSEQTKNNPWT